MTQTRLGTVVPILILLLSILSCDRFNGSSNVAKPTQVVDFPSMIGKSLQEMTTMLGPLKQNGRWELPEGELDVHYEIPDEAKGLMSSIDYQLKPDFGVGSPEEMMALLNINVQGKEAKKDARGRGFFTYDISMNGKSCFIDIHPRDTDLIFGPRGPIYTVAELYIQNPDITLYSSADYKGKETPFYEQQTNINVSVGSVLLGYGHWEVCTEVNFTGNCKILDNGVGEYFEKSKNFSSFGLGETIRSLRPVEKK